MRGLEALTTELGRLNNEVLIIVGFLVLPEALLFVLTQLDFIEAGGRAN